MKHLAEQVLDAASRRGVSYADVRVVEHRDRHVSTKNGKMGTVSASESVGAGVRVLVWDDPEFPRLLRDIPAPPFAL